jgi:hypothetical protein
MGGPDLHRSGSSKFNERIKPDLSDPTKNFQINLEATSWEKAWSCRLFYEELRRRGRI